MRIHSEIKEFTKNTLILTCLFTGVFYISWDYIWPYLGVGVNADNDTRFLQVDPKYMGSVATALSLNVGKKSTPISQGPVNLADDVVSIGEVLAYPKEGERRLIGSHTLFLSEYVNVLKTEITPLLDQSTDRAHSLDEHIDLLKSYYTRTSERTVLLSEQTGELKTRIKAALEKSNLAKAKMEEKYKNFDSEGVDVVIHEYVTAKDEENRARVYLTYLERFQKGYGILQGQNKILLDTLINNREALIKRSTVVIPDSGSDLLKKLNLITTEASYKESLK